MVAKEKNLKSGQRGNVPHALTVFTIAATFTSLFTPAYLNGINESLTIEHSKLMQERELLVERRNKELSIISSLKTPESVYKMALLQDLDLQLVNNE
ncbi:MAG: hypothetical protein PQJ49_07640 [Sphaerochaetaceae bacterium]|nr:hypothetical protein [Sphaerochaetaceae bacterium]MDC7237048.1 hypothetical protein [Sphaerochaetaceae bacterium]MDC7249769.1 hypothetical protein [Sphaerochaetaceae bacterium]